MTFDRDGVIQSALFQRKNIGTLTKGRSKYLIPRFLQTETISEWSTKRFSMGNPWPLFRWFFVSSSINTILQWINVKNDPYLIWQLDSNFQPLRYEPLPITTT